jgi:hypothetical protein
VLFDSKWRAYGCCNITYLILPTKEYYIIIISKYLTTKVSYYLGYLYGCSKKKWACNETVRQLFIDVKEAYDSVRREVLYNILTEFGVPIKLVQLIKMCLNDTYCKVCLGKHLSDCFSFQNGLKQGDALSPMPFNFQVQESQACLKLNGTHQLRVFENRVLRIIFLPKRNEITGGWKILDNKKDEMGGTCNTNGG